MESYFVQLVWLSVEKDILLWQTETTIVFKFIVQMGNFYTSLVAKEMEMDSLAITKDGSIVVADFRNNRVQVFGRVG